VSRFRKILVPLDFSDHSSRALDLAIDLAKESGAELHLLHAYEIPTSIATAYGVALPQAVWDGIEAAARSRLDERLARVEQAGLKGVDHVVGAAPSDAILDTAGEIGADLIVMGTRGLTGLRHVLLGSVAERTLRLAPCPVLTLKGDDG
jgi:nucleotide-binding universal stress UspA family protein